MNGYFMDRIDRGLKRLAQLEQRDRRSQLSRHTVASVNVRAGALLTKIEAFNIEEYRDQPSAMERAIARFEEGRN